MVRFATGFICAFVFYSLALAAYAAWPASVTERNGLDRTPADLTDWPPLSGAVTIRSEHEARERRRELVRYIFGARGLPERLPLVEEGVEDSRFTEGVPNLERIDRLTVRMPLGFRSYVHLAHPRRANGRLLVFHNGHNQGWADGRRPISYFLRRGFAVLVLSMPLYGETAHPSEFRTRKCGNVMMAFPEHDLLACLDSPLRPFLEPVAVALNYAETLGYRKADMIGLSGGGWTTAVYAALDTRVQRSFPVAGTIPLHVFWQRCRFDPHPTLATCFDDMESRLPAFYRIANYLDLHVLGAWGRGRKQLVVFNARERSALGGTSFREWAPRVRGAVGRLGTGRFNVVGDTTQARHIVSPWALQRIAEELQP